MTKKRIKKIGENFDEEDINVKYAMCNRCVLSWM